MAQAMVEFKGEPATNPNLALAVEQVWHNFWKAKYSVYPVMMHVLSGYINVSQICKDYGTQF